MANGRLKNAIGQVFYPSPFWPIGSIFLNTVNENPSKYFGGTWVSFGTGRCLVGVDTSQTEFNKVEKIGGSKFLQKHNHPINIQGGNKTTSRFTYTYDSQSREYSGTDLAIETGTGTAGNLQPYITVYMWKRTA